MVSPSRILILSLLVWLPQRTTQLSDSVGEAVRLQTEREGRVRCSAWRRGPHHTVVLRLRHRSNTPMAKTTMLEPKPSQTLQSDGSNSCPAGCRAARAHQTPAGNSAMPNHMRASDACWSFIRTNAA